MYQMNRSNRYVISFNTYILIISRKFCAHKIIKLYTKFVELAFYCLQCQYTGLNKVICLQAIRRFSQKMFYMDRLLLLLVRSRYGNEFFFNHFKSFLHRSFFIQSHHKNWFCWFLRL